MSYAALRDHFQGLERLRGDVLTMASRAKAVISPNSADDGGAELRQIHQAVRRLADYIKGTEAIPDSHLESILRSLTLPIVVTSPTGVVALVNGSAKDLLGADGLAVGQPISDCVGEVSLERALAATAASEQPISASLEIPDRAPIAATLIRLPQGGVVVSFPSAAAESSAGALTLEYDLEALNPLPEPGPIADDTPLAALPMLVLDTETTGLDVKTDRVVSIGAVRMVGERIFRHVTFHQLCNPHRPIPPAATRVHHITDDDVADAPEYAEVWQNCLPLLEGAVMVGYNIPFDIAMLRHESRRADLAWQDPPFLDILLLAVALIDDLRNDNLEGLTDYLGVDISDRHNALGDSLMEAETLACLLPRLEDKGIVTYGDAKAFSQQAKPHSRRAKEIRLERRFPSHRTKRTGRLTLVAYPAATLNTEAPPSYLMTRLLRTSLTPFTPAATVPARAFVAAVSTKPLSWTMPLKVSTSMSKMLRALSPTISARTLLLMTESSTYSPVLSLVLEPAQAAIETARKPTSMSRKMRRVLIMFAYLRIHKEPRRTQNQSGLRGLSFNLPVTDHCGAYAGNWNLLSSSVDRKEIAIIQRNAIIER